ncbi:MAG: cadherin-like beta sandwich domain-containing protein [Clostridia bacterium]|nr:cadherin-like beta sandwich domain-containing protein [Clostridia bacterium]
MKLMKFKKTISAFCLLVIATFLSNFVFAAGSFSVSSSAGSVTVGGTVTITISTNSCAGKFSVASSNTGVATVSTGSIFVDGSGKVTVTTKSAGTATITVTATDVADSDLNDVTGSKQVTITATNPVAPPVDNNNSNNNQGNNNNTATKSNNNYLKVLQVNYEGLTPNFNKSKTTYSLNVGKDVGSIKVTATPEHGKATAYVSGNTNLKNGDNNVYITVTAENGSKRTYTIVVTKSADPEKANSYLENLIVENAKLSPEFSKEILEYDCGTVGAEVESLKILTFPEIEAAKVEITGNDKLIVGENNIVIKVTSADGSTTKEYKIKVVKEETVAALNGNDDNDDIPLVTKEKPTSLFDKIVSAVKNNALLVLMYVFVIVEFIQIIYLYRKLNKGKDYQYKPNKESNNEEKIARGRSGAFIANKIVEEEPRDEELNMTSKEEVQEEKIELNIGNIEDITNIEEDNTLTDNDGNNDYKNINLHLNLDSLEENNDNKDNI